MKNMIKITLFSLLASSITFNALANNNHSAHSAHQPMENTINQRINTKGVVKQIDSENKKITITHEPIPSMGWPAMTMRFTYKDPMIIAGINVGDEVDLDFVQEGAISLIHRISISQ